MVAVARIALNLRPPVAASCLSRIALTTARLASVSSGLTGSLPSRLVVVDVEAQDVPVLDGVGDRVLVQRAAGRGLPSFVSVWSSPVICLAVAFASKMGVPVKPKSWAFGKNSLMA